MPLDSAELSVSLEMVGSLVSITVSSYNLGQRVLLTYLEFIFNIMLH